MFSTKISSSILGLGVVLSLVFGLVLPMSASAASLYRQLEIGMRGNDVSDLQTFLARDVSIYPQGLITGYFGVLTRTAVSNFQARNGIATVGRVGPITMAAINAQMAGGNVGADIYAPSIYSLALTPTNSGVTINWNTSENSAAIVYYSVYPLSMVESSATNGVTIGGSSFLVHADLRNSHSATITGLQPNTTYYYVVYVKDGSGNETITWPTTFKTNQ